MKNRFVSGLMIAAVVSGGTLLGAQSASAAGCTLVAQKPTYASSTLTGVGGRTGCADSQSTEVVLKKDRNGLPDGVLASSSKNVSNATWSVSKANPGSGDFYIETISATGAKIQSSRLSR